jgi:hypothetical protein
MSTHLKNKIINFIKANLKKNHILVKNSKVFNYYYNSKKNLNFIVDSKYGNIRSILGYIPGSKYNKKRQINPTPLRNIHYLYLNHIINY